MNYSIREILRAFSSILRWWYVVSPWEQSVRVRLGKHVSVLGAGVHWRIPFADVIYKQSIRRRQSMISTMTLTTLDRQTVTVAGQVAYAIGDIGLLYNTLHDAEDTIEGEVRGAIADYLVNHEAHECTPALLHENLFIDLAQYGLADVEVYITDFAVVPTIRLLQGSPRDYKLGGSLYMDTASE